MGSGVMVSRSYDVKRRNCELGLMMNTSPSLFRPGMSCIRTTEDVWGEPTTCYEPDNRILELCTVIKRSMG